MQVDTHRRGGEPGSRGDLRARHPLDEPKHQRLAIGLGQRLDEGEELQGIGPFRCVIVRRQIVRQLHCQLAAWRWKSMARLRAIVASQPPNAAGSRSPASQFQAVRKTSWTRSSTSPRGTRQEQTVNHAGVALIQRPKRRFVAVLRRPREPAVFCGVRCGELRQRHVSHMARPAFEGTRCFNGTCQ